MAQQPPLLRDVIDIKENISTSDFVLSLAEATTPEGAQNALKDYVVTERLLENFDEALALIKSSLDGHRSKAAYLHGSFGSGKSHFMAVLYALLSGDPAARARTEFDPVLTKHEWLTTDGRRFLLVPYHMLGAKALEQRVLGGYVTHVKKLHPDAPTPQVYRTDSLFADIRANRATYGDEAVIRGLGGSDAGDGETDEWGEGFGWTPQLLDTALAAEENHEGGTPLNLRNPSTPAELRAKLVNDAGTNLFPGFARNAAENEHGFISLDAGLSVIAEHAKSLGYDGLILFLDELILWLATLIHEQKFVAREASKITNFVEGGDARRAIPVVSFIARQRDLRELVGEEVSGAAEASIQDTLNLASGRFDKITLEDRNLPQIAHARILKPRDAEAERLVEAAFEQTRRVGTQVWDTLLGSEKGTTGADAESFRLTYPFSPAFMDTLVHISSALQRSRTGLKLMGELLADHRNEIRLGQLIPVGDLYPVIAEGGDKPFTDSLKVVFEAADKLYKTKLRPYLLSSYDITEDDVEQYVNRPESITDPQRANRCRMFVGDNRLVCTLLLSALAPSVPSLTELTIRRLGALNHGSVLAPIPGAEVGIIKNKVAEWAARFPEIKETGTDANPGVRLELSGVDVDSVIANAQVNDNPGNRVALARRLLSGELGVEHGQLSDQLGFVWRGTSRTAEIVFGNVADEDELPDHDLMPQEDGRWRIAIDLPFDEGEWARSRTSTASGGCASGSRVSGPVSSPGCPPICPRSASPTSGVSSSSTRPSPTSTASTPSTPATSTPTTAAAPRASSKPSARLCSSRSRVPSSRRTGSPRSRPPTWCPTSTTTSSRCPTWTVSPCPSGRACTTASGMSRAGCSPTSTRRTPTSTPTAPAPPSNPPTPARCSPMCGPPPRRVTGGWRSPPQSGSSCSGSPGPCGSGSRRRRTSSCPATGPTTSVSSPAPRAAPGTCP